MEEVKIEIKINNIWNTDELRVDEIKAGRRLSYILSNPFHANAIEIDGEELIAFAKHLASEPSVPPEQYTRVLIDLVRSALDYDGAQITAIGINWACEKGVGNILITQTITAGGNVFYHIDNEMMSRDFIKRVLCAIVDKATLESES